MVSLFVYLIPQKLCTPFCTRIHTLIPTCRLLAPQVSYCFFPHLLIFNYFLPWYVTTSPPYSWVISFLTWPNVCFNFNISYVFISSHGKILKYDAMVSYKSSPLASSSSLPLLPLRWYLVIRILFSCDSTCFVYFSYYGF